jgi:glycosyltransferase involved in cell wall biosynthesis
MSDHAPVTAIVTAYRRLEQTLKTLDQLAHCVPNAAETMVHVDGNQTDIGAVIRKTCPNVRVVVTAEHVGPGGGRNRLVSAAEQPIVASFDDDSYPIDSDYFARLTKVASTFSDAAVITTLVYHRGEKVVTDRFDPQWVADFSGCGCAYRKAAFLETGGYVPVPVAYGVEEVDLALRLRAQGRRILFAPSLRVFHDTDLRHHADASVTAASIKNVALVGFLRYPPPLWPVWLGQCLNRTRWLLQHGRREGVVSGIRGIPEHLWRYRAYRDPLSTKAVYEYLRLRRNPRPAGSESLATNAMSAYAR